MFNKVTKSFQLGQHTVVLETGEIARQAGGAVLVTVDDTEKTFAAGKIAGGLFKREG